MVGTRRRGLVSARGLLLAEDRYAELGLSSQKFPLFAPEIPSFHHRISPLPRLSPSWRGFPSAQRTCRPFVLAWGARPVALAQGGGTRSTEQRLGCFWPNSRTRGPRSWKPAFQNLRLDPVIPKVFSILYASLLFHPLRFHPLTCHGSARHHAAARRQLGPRSRLLTPPCHGGMGRRAAEKQRGWVEIKAV